MRGLAGFVALAIAGPATAETPSDFMTFLGGHGCTLGSDSRAAAVASGFEPTFIDAITDAALENETAQQQGAYVVFDAQICEIRLPLIESAYDVESPEVRAITSEIVPDQEHGAPGCYLEDAPTMFDTLAGGERGGGFDAYIAFVGAGLVSGDLRFYETSPLRAPVSFQSVTGACTGVANIDAIRRSHDVLQAGFGDYIRAVGAENSCDQGAGGTLRMRLSAEQQGYDASIEVEDQPEFNAWLWFEYDLIAMAAGWHEGMTGTERGTPRPPLCHF